MGKDNIITLKKPETVKDLLTEVIRTGACQLLKAAVEAEINEFLGQHSDHRVDQGKPRFVRNGYCQSARYKQELAQLPSKYHVFVTERASKMELILNQASSQNTYVVAQA